MNTTKIISIKTTSLCQLRCKNCFVVPWMNENKGWHWSIKSVRRFIRATIDSGYHFNLILLTGGEPLLWDNLYRALKMIRKAKITDRIKILSNSIAVNEKNLDWFEKVVEIIDVIRISRYVGNEESIEIIKISFRANPKIKIFDKTNFNMSPNKINYSTLPAICSCDYPSVFGDQLDICGVMRFLSIYYDIPFDKNFTTEIKPGYLDNFESRVIIIKKHMQKICALCMGNRNVLKLLNKEKNYCLKGESNEISIA